ncbi:metallophosphoesterase, partial [Patulibacter sp. S7RM1-6]
MRTPDRTILQLSDPHLTAAASGADERLALALDAIRASGVRPDALLLSGDLTDDGSAEGYARLREAVDPVAAALGAPVIALPGNHDLTAPFREALLDGGPVDRVVDLAGLRVVVLDTNVPGAAHGVLRDEQLAWLEDRLAEPAPHGTVLALHHPPIPTPHPLMARLALRRPERLAAVVRGRDVGQIVCGHAHAAAA